VACVLVFKIATPDKNKGAIKSLCAPDYIYGHFMIFPSIDFDLLLGAQPLFMNLAFR